MAIKIYATNNDMQKEWESLQKIMQQAANEVVEKGLGEETIKDVGIRNRRIRKYKHEGFLKYLYGHTEENKEEYRQARNKAMTLSRKVHRGS